VRFQWTQFVGSQPGDLFGTPELAVLERPWRGGTTSDLLARMEIHASVAGCAFITRPKPNQLSMLRPDRVTIIMGSMTDADDPAEAPDVEIAGFIHTTTRGKMTMFFPDEVAYYAPIPDPDYRFLGMSWITPVIREMQGDSLATEHKARFFTNAATPNLAIKFDPTVSIEQVRRFKAMLESEHRGAWNAYKTLYLGGGADPVVIGKDFREMDFSATQGKGESRLAAAAGVPPSWVGFSEGLQGSSLNSGNFQAARRRFSDGTMQHLWTNAATSLETLVKPPNSGASLWFDSRVPFMREDADQVAQIQAQQAATIASLIAAGFIPDTAIKAVMGNDWGLLRHSGLVSVQLLPADGTPPPGQPGAASGNGKAPSPAGIGG
jgi:phage portal protein BeeE